VVLAIILEYLQSVKKQRKVFFKQTNDSNKVTEATNDADFGTGNLLIKPSTF